MGYRYPTIPKPEKRMSSTAGKTPASSGKSKYLFLALLMAGSCAFAHPGGLAEDGCHNRIKTGECHCHEPPGDRQGCPKIQWRGATDAPEAETEKTTFDTIRIASWNLNNLHWKNDVAMRSYAPRRRNADYETLKGYIRRIDADIIAFQEVNGPLAAARIFPIEDYDIHISGRYDSNQNDIYTGFAVRSGRFARVRKRDVPELEPRSDKSAWGLRWGVDLSVELGSGEKTKTLRLLNIHLKSRCAFGNLLKPKGKHCKRLVTQIPPLEKWIDERWQEGVPFVVMGDFNRAFERYDERDHLWQAIDDADPPGLELHRLPNDHPNECWKGTKNHFEHGIDFFVFGARAWEWTKPHSFRQILWEDRDMEARNIEHRLPSDHCPITVDLF